MNRLLPGKSNNTVSSSLVPCYGTRDVDPKSNTKRVCTRSARIVRIAPSNTSIIEIHPRTIVFSRLLLLDVVLLL
jgi:hypothetical protein